MTALGKLDLISYLSKQPPIVEGMLDPEIQVGPNGIDLSLRDIERFISPGSVGFGSDDRLISKTAKLEFDEDSEIKLDPGAYKIVYNEIVHIPLDIVAIGRPRSSLLRCGATVETAIWDSGYHGRSESLLVVYNSSGMVLHRNARVIQLIFLKNNKAVDKGYMGRYQGENIEP
jgi:dUTP pyrophosphatase